jgi:GcrA cell cycle regulator
MARSAPVWTPAECSIAAKMLRDGLSAGQMAPHFGISRNAVIGRVHRDEKLSAIGFHGRSGVPLRRSKLTGIVTSPRVKPITIQNPFGKKGIAGVLATPKVKQSKVHGGGVASAVRARLVPAENRPAVPAERVFAGVPTSRCLTLMQLTERTCKWPHGDPRTADFSFCGNTAVELGPYCPYHARLAYAPRAMGKAS